LEGTTLDGVVPVAHSEGSTTDRGKPNNLSFLLSTLGGWSVNPNVGAVLVVEDAAGDGAVTWLAVTEHARANGRGAAARHANMVCTDDGRS
jgi:altronate dehydratase